MFFAFAGPTSFKCAVYFWSATWGYDLCVLNCAVDKEDESC